MLSALQPHDDPQALRDAGRDLLSLALLDARNQLLQALAAFDEAGMPGHAQQQAWQTALRSAAWQQRWLLDQPQASALELLATAANPREGDRAPGVADDGNGNGNCNRNGLALLAEVLEASLEKLSQVPDEPEALLPWHTALQHEDRLRERLVFLLQRGAPPPRAQRPPLWLPSQRWTLGSGRGRLPGVPYSQWGAEEVLLPECEIDAQPVNWQQYAEFANDGGYDRPELWGQAGWAWLQDQPEPRRAPRHVAQFQGGVLAHRGLGPTAALQRAAPGQAAMHVTRFEAKAWCCWAGRRLPTEAEWELAAATATARGFVWGDVHEWVAGSARAWADAGSAPAGCVDLAPPAGSQGVMRGASFATARRWHQAKARRYAPPGHDDAWCGFRSCAL